MLVSKHHQLVELLQLEIVPRSLRIRIITITKDPNTLAVSSAGRNKFVAIVVDDSKGMAATILPGVTINDGAVVAAGAVVWKDIHADCTVGDVPEGLIKKPLVDEKGLERGNN